MQYSPDLIRISTKLEVDPQMFSLYPVHGDAFSCELSWVRCYLNGYTLLCLNTTDTVTVLGGAVLYLVAVALRSLGRKPAAEQKVTE